MHCMGTILRNFVGVVFLLLPGSKMHAANKTFLFETDLICNLPRSINQSNFYSANIPGEARLSGATAKSVFNSKIEETVP